MRLRAEVISVACNAKDLKRIEHILQDRVCLLHLDLGCAMRPAFRRRHDLVDRRRRRVRRNRQHPFANQRIGERRLAGAERAEQRNRERPLPQTFRFLAHGARERPHRRQARR